MRVPVSRDRSWFVPIRAFVVLVSVLLVAAVAIAVALAAPSTKSYGATIGQTGQETYSFVLTNLESSTQTLGSANVTLPGAFSVASAAVTATPAGKTWTAHVNGQTVELRAADKNSPLAPGQSVTVQITATAPCGADYAVGVQVKQSNSFSGPPGNDFQGPSPLSLSVVGPAASFELTVPSPQVVRTPFDATLAASDACGEPAIYYNRSPTLTGDLQSSASGTPPAYGSFSFANGVGTASVTAVRSQDVATLTATDSGVSPALTDESNEFAVVDTICRHGDRECRVATGDTAVNAPVPPQDATLALSLLRSGHQFTCGGTTTSPIGAFAQIVPEGYAGGAEGAPIPVTLQLTLPTGAGNPTLCLSTSKAFDPASFVPVPTCSRTSPVPPCEQARSRMGSSFSVTFLIAPTDPWAGGR